MPANAIKVWLKKKQGQAVLYAWGYLLLVGAIGCVVSFLTAGLVYLFVKLIVLIVLPMWPHASGLAALLTLPIVVLAFLDSRNSSRDDMSIMPLWLAREYFDIGPRMVWHAIRQLAEAEHFAKIDAELCADVLEYVASGSGPLSHSELLKRFPLLKWHTLVDQLQFIPGVVVFRYEQRIALLTPLRLELRQLSGQRIRVEIPREEPPPQPEPEPVYEPEKLKPTEILGVSDRATLSEIKLAYRNRMKEWHPDRFPNLDEESRQMAEDWTKALNAAYEELLRHHNGGRRR